MNTLPSFSLLTGSPKSRFLRKSFLLLLHSKDTLRLPVYFPGNVSLPKSYLCIIKISIVIFGLLVGFGFNGPLRQYFSLYRAVSQREGERGKKRKDRCE